LKRVEVEDDAAPHSAGFQILHGLVGAGNRDFESPFSPFFFKGKIRLNLLAVKHARLRSGIGDFSGPCEIVGLADVSLTQLERPDEAVDTPQPNPGDSPAAAFSPPLGRRRCLFSGRP